MDEIDLPNVFVHLDTYHMNIEETGMVTFESFSSSVIEPELSIAIFIWRDLWSDSKDLARHARSFIGTHVHAAHPPGSVGSQTGERS